MAIQDQHAAELTDHLRRIVDKRLRSLIDHRRFWAMDDPETALHDLRVSSRRLRAFVEAFRGSMGDKLHARAAGPLKRITRAAGSVRDWDVQIALLEGRAAAVPPTDVERAAAEHLLERFVRERAMATEKAKKRLRTVDFDELHVTLSAALSKSINGLPQPAGALRLYVREWIERLVAEAASHAPPEVGEHAVSMHHLRIDMKKIRYALELFEPVFGSHYALVHERATLLQETLGTHHDLVVIDEVLERAIAVLDARERPVLSRGTTHLRRSFASERAVALALCGAAAFEPGFWLEQLRTSLGEQ